LGSYRGRLDIIADILAVARQRGQEDADYVSGESELSSFDSVFG
jgi:hypothetical protein